MKRQVLATQLFA
jgi:hypothetical protein